MKPSVYYRCQCVVLGGGLHVNVVDVPQSKAQCLGLHFSPGAALNGGREEEGEGQPEQL